MFVVRVTVADGELIAGDTIDVVYGETAGGSRGMRAAIVSTRPEPLLVTVDRGGDGHFEPVSHRATLEAGRALTIPHHTGKFPQPISVVDHDPELRRNFEIYSAHGLSEAYDPTHPLAFEHSDFTNYSTSAPEGLTAQDAWARGLVLSTIAASDDHRSHPGQPHWGIAAVTAPELTRTAIFDALHARRTYGTTGARILLDFRVNNEPMGGETSTDGAPRLQVTAHGTELIESVEILRYSDPDGAFSVIYDLRPDALDFEWSGTDGEFRDESVYYLRLKQRGHTRGRIVMAWSSPIWVRQSP